MLLTTPIGLANLEESKVRFRMIFNEDADQYNFKNAEQINLVIEYGKVFGSLEKVKEMIELHLKLDLEFSRVGIFLEDDKILDIIIAATRGGTYEYSASK